MTPPEDRVIFMFVGLLTNHDRTHSQWVLVYNTLPEFLYTIRVRTHISHSTTCTSTAPVSVEISYSRRRDFCISVVITTRHHQSLYTLFFTRDTMIEV